MYGTLFLTFIKIGAFTSGGGYAMLPLIQREVVDRGWMKKEEFIDLFAVAQSLPGIFAVNISIFVGYKLKKLPGAICCALGTILPSFLIILAIALVFSGYQDNPVVVRIFKGIRPVVVSLIVVPMIRMAMKNNGTWWAWAITAGAMAGVAFLQISPIWILLVLLVTGTAVSIFKERRSRNG